MSQFELFFKGTFPFYFGNFMYFLEFSGIGIMLLGARIACDLRWNLLDDMLLVYAFVLRR